MSSCPEMRNWFHAWVSVSEEKEEDGESKREREKKNQKKHMTEMDRHGKNPTNAFRTFLHSRKIYREQTKSQSQCRQKGKDGVCEVQRNMEHVCVWGGFAHWTIKALENCWVCSSPYGRAYYGQVCVRAWPHNSPSLPHGSRRTVWNTKGEICQIGVG